MLETLKPKKFSHPDITANGKARAQVAPDRLKTLWFNTGTLCNLECTHCYIESSPKNDRLVYITTDEVKTFLDEIQEQNMGTREIGFTGGEPFMNPYIIDILEASLSKGFQVLVLTNGMRPMMNKSIPLLKLNKNYRSQLQIRVSLDHYSEENHTMERGHKAWKPAIQGLQWLSQSGFHLSVAGRTVWGETDESMRTGYQKMFSQHNIKVDPFHPESLVLFPEMNKAVDTPEITTDCWKILGLRPESLMCAASRMVVKRKGASKPSVAACTLLPYDRQFDMGTSLKGSWQPVKLNHPHCSQFCVLGGGKCSR